MQVEQQAQDCGIQILTGLRRDASAGDASAFAQSLADIAADPAANIAVTPELALARQSAEARRRWAKYAVGAALAGVGVLCAFSILSHRRSLSAEAAGGTAAGATAASGAQGVSAGRKVLAESLLSGWSWSR